MTATMRAIVHEQYGRAPEDVLRLDSVPVPEVGDGEVLVRVRAASVDRGTWHIMSGVPYPIRAAGFGLRAPKGGNPGRSFAGTVSAVGAGAEGFAVGDEVYGICEGSFAEYATASPAKLAPKPASMSFEEAAALPISAMTALQAVRDHGQVTRGQRVLVVGASGGVGTFAVQIAKAFGATVTGVCSTAKVALVKGLGADAVVDYATEDFADGGPYDVILDTGGMTALAHLRSALTPKGRLVIVGGETDGRWLGGAGRALHAMALSPFVGQHLGTFVATENAADLVALRDLVDAGDVAAPVDRTFPLDEVPAAIRYLLDGRAAGKVVITL